MNHPCATFDLIPPAPSADEQARAAFILLNTSRCGPSAPVPFFSDHVAATSTP